MAHDPKVVAQLVSFWESHVRLSGGDNPAMYQLAHTHRCPRK